MQWTSFLLCRVCVLGRKYIKNDVKFISLSRQQITKCLEMGDQFEV